MKSLYCRECNNYLMAGDGELHDCSCGWKQPVEAEEVVRDVDDLTDPAREVIGRWVNDELSAEEAMSELSKLFFQG